MRLMTDYVTSSQFNNAINEIKDLFKEQNSVFEERFDKVDNILDRLEKRVDKLENRMETVKLRLTQLALDNIDIKRDLKSLTNLVMDMGSELVTQSEFKKLIRLNNLKYSI